MKTCAFLTCKDLDGFVVDDELLNKPFLERSWAIQSVPWDQKTDWSQFDAVVVRTTWDYQKRLGEFFEVLDTIHKAGVPFFNPLSVIKWNAHKSYLFDLASKTVPIIPTCRLPIAEIKNLKTFFDLWDVPEMIVKPFVSANADNTFRIHRSTFASQVEPLKEVAVQKELLVQPFVENIVSEGEYSLLYFGHEFSHALRKKPKDNDFRVQEEHGGEIIPVEPSESLLKAADKVMSSLDQKLLYARVDLVEGRKDEWLLMELELVEPSLYLRTHPQAAANFTKHFLDFVGTKMRRTNSHKSENVLT